MGVALVPKLSERVRLRGNGGTLPEYLPRGNEAQCPTCNRIFSSDTAAEKHKRYARPATKGCKDPQILGMIPTVREGGRTVWVRPSHG